MSDTRGYQGAEWFLSGGSSFNNMSFMIRQIIAGKAFAALVIVKGVVSAGGVSPAGRVSVQPMVDQVDGAGNRIPHGVIYDIPYMRIQGGTNAIIIDPVVGDIGLAVMCDRDTSTVKATGKISGPGSRRHNSWSDGMYFGGYLNGVPDNYVILDGSGIKIVSPNPITMTAPSMTINANVTINGTLTDNGVNVGSTHHHSQSGGGFTGTPS